MKMFKKLGQTATEYLIILAVVIVIALIVVGVMGGIPGVGKGGKKGVDTAAWSTKQIGLTQVGVSASANEIYVMRNNQPEVVIVTDVRFGSFNMLSGGNRTLSAGEEARVDAGAVIDGTACPAGNSFSYPVVIAYTVQSTGASYNVTGEYSGTCAS